MSNSKNRSRNGYQAQRSEAQDKPSPRTSVKYNGHTYNIPHPNDWDLDIFDFMYEAQVEEEPLAAIGIMRNLLGVSQWKAFKGRNKSIEDIGKFMKATQDTFEKDADTPN